MSKDALEWLAKHRGLNVELLEAMGIRGVDHPALGPAIAFPYIRGGEVYAHKFRAYPEKRWSSTTGVARGVYNEDDLKRMKELPIVITEGEIDCLTMIQSGWERSISLPDGWTEQGNKTDALLEQEDRLRQSPYVIVAGDSDKAGESLPRVVANILKGHDVRTVTWPGGCKDANEVLMKYGSGEIASCVNAAKRIDPPGGFVTSFSDLPPLSSRRVLRVGQPPFDWRIALELGAMSVVTGIPGHGKSTFVTWVADSIARREKIRVGMMAFETHPHRIRDQLSRINTGFEWDALKDDWRGKLLAEIDKRWCIVHRTYDESAHHLGWLEQMVYTLAVRDQCKLIIIDPWNELEHMPETGESMTAYINFALQQIRVWAEKLEVHILLVAHPRKIEAGRHPGGYDVADSAAFANKPSLGLTVHQGEEAFEVHTWKVRDTQLYGVERGKSEVQFHPAKMTYSKL